MGTPKPHWCADPGRLAVWTLVLARRRSGIIIMLLGGLLAAGMPVIHTKVNMAKSGAFLFIWTLFALGATGTLTVILAARGLRAGGTMTTAEHESPDRRG